MVKCPGTLLRRFFRGGRPEISELERSGCETGKRWDLAGQNMGIFRVKHVDFTRMGKYTCINQLVRGKFNCQLLGHVGARIKMPECPFQVFVAWYPRLAMKDSI